MSKRHIKRDSERKAIKRIRIEYLARLGLSNTEIAEHYPQATPAFIAMIADRIRREIADFDVG